MITTFVHRFRRVLSSGAMAAGMLGLSACSVQESLLQQQQPQIIRPADVESNTGALALYTGALGRFRNSLSGGDNNQERIWNFEALLTDEFSSADSFSQRNDADQRTTQTNDGTLFPTYNAAQQSRGFARSAINSLRKFAPTETTKLGEMYFEMGFFELTLGQAFCNGIPLGETVDGVPQYTEPLTDAQVFTQAIARFDSALTLLSGTDANTVGIKNAVLVAKARAQIDLGQFAAAAATVASVPTSFVYLITYSITTQTNEWYTLSPGSKRYNVGDSVDTKGNRILNAIPFVSAKDPRVLSKAPAGVGLDTFTPFIELGNWGREDPLPLVSGLDARLIEAEAKLQASDFAGMTGILNALRAAPPAQGNFKVAAGALTPLTVPADKPSATDQYFREKAFWQYGRGERMSDLRRLVRQYGRTQDKVYPTGPFFKGGSYGTIVAFPVPDVERSNPKFGGCLDTNA